MSTPNVMPHPTPDKASEVPETWRAPLTRLTEQHLDETLDTLEVGGDGALADVLRALVGEVRRLGEQNRALEAALDELRETAAHIEMAHALKERLDTLDAAIAAAVAS